MEIVISILLGTTPLATICLIASFLEDYIKGSLLAAFILIGGTGIGLLIYQIGSHFAPLFIK